MSTVTALDFARAENRPERRKAGFRLTYFFVTMIVVSAVLAVGVIVWRGTGELMHLTPLNKVVSAVSVLAGIVVMRLVTGDRLALFGLGGPRGLRNFAIGLLCGVAFMAVELLCMNLLGGYSFGAVTANADVLEKSALINAALFLMVGFSEEGMFRGYALVQLSRAASFWPAVLIWSFIFGAIHLGNPGESWFGGLSAGLFGLAFAISFRLTGSLWFAFGLHAAWDYAESFIFGVPDSGFPAKDALLHPSFHGAEWLTGGSVGPEASVLVLVPLVMMLGASWLLRTKAPVVPAPVV